MSKSTPVAADFMQTVVQTVSPKMSLVELERFLMSEKLSGAPVVEGGKVMGVVSRSDIVRQLVVERTTAEYAADYHAEPGSWASLSPVSEAQWITGAAAGHLERLTVADAMVTEVVAVRPDTPVAEVARQMVEHGVHRVLVTERDELAGILTTMDLVRVIADGRAALSPKAR